MFLLCGSCRICTVRLPCRQQCFSRCSSNVCDICKHWTACLTAERYDEGGLTLSASRPPLHVFLLLSTALAAPDPVNIVTETDGCRTNTCVCVCVWRWRVTGRPVQFWQHRQLQQANKLQTPTTDICRLALHTVHITLHTQYTSLFTQYITRHHCCCAAHILQLFVQA